MNDVTGPASPFQDMPNELRMFLRRRSLRYMDPHGIMNDHVLMIVPSHCDVGVLSALSGDLQGRRGIGLQEARKAPWPKT